MGTKFERKTSASAPALAAQVLGYPETLTQRRGVQEGTHIRRLLRTEVRCTITHKPPGFTQSGG